MKKNLFVSLFQTALMFIYCSSSAQQTYLFSKTTGNAYSDLVNDNNVPGFNQAGLYNILDFQGETLEFFGLPFTFGGLKTLAIGSAPFLRVDNDSSTIIIDVAFSYIDTIDVTSRISYNISGAAGNNILKVQYKNFKLRYGQAGNFINSQIWYYQQSGVIELHYGPGSANNASGFNTVNGPNIGVFYSPDDFSSCYEKLWCNGSPASLTLDSSATLVFNAMTGVPDQGTVFRFTPKTTQTVTTLSVKEFNKVNMFQLYPNPAGNTVQINSSEYIENVTIINLEGKIVFESKSVKSKMFSIKTNEFMNGIYFVQITGKQKNATQKLVINNR